MAARALGVPRIVAIDSVNATQTSMSSLRSCSSFTPGQLPVEKLIRTYRFEGFEQALHAPESRATIKPVLVFD
jgi:hypothetical protein